MLLAMSNAALIGKPKFSNWFILSTGVFLTLVLSGIALMILANGRLVNTVDFPIKEYFGIFKIIWSDNPWGAIRVMSNKSILLFGHYDSRSTLYLWTLEFNSTALLVYICVSIAGGWLIQHMLTQAGISRGCFYISVTGYVLLLLSSTYATVLAHCAGPTWVTYVALYGVGFEEVSLNPIWQWVCAIVGGLLMITAIINEHHRKQNYF
jgi:hypothetical protein